MQLQQSGADFLDVLQALTSQVVVIRHEINFRGALPNFHYPSLP